MFSDMAYTVNSSVRKSAVLGGQDRPFSTYPYAQRSLKLYDRNARPVSVMLTDDRSRLYDSLLRSETSGYTLVQALVKQPGNLEVTKMLQQGVILALDERRSMLLYRYGNGDLMLYAVIQQIADRSRVAGLNPDVEEGIRAFLKSCYAGWHHVFHEVIAMASGFTAAPVHDTRIDELIQLIQVPPRFPV